MNNINNNTRLLKGLPKTSKYWQDWKKNNPKLNKYLRSIGIGMILKQLYSTLSNLMITRKRLSKEERTKINIADNLKEILIGLCLGDLHIERKSLSRNALLRFEQGQVHEKYILYLYSLFKDFCRSEPKYSTRKPDIRTGKTYNRIKFQTLFLPCFNEFHELFYLNSKKIIPSNIGNLLTSRGLAFWAMDDGYKEKTGFILSTQSYSFEEVELLIKVLKSNFDLDCTMRTRKISKSKIYYLIYIRVSSMKKFKDLVRPYFYDSMMYKLK